MKVAVIAVGRMKAGAEQELAGRYLDRFARSAAGLGLDFAGVTELAESRAATAQERRRDESGRLAALLARGSTLVLLDERGRALSSPEIAGRIAAERDGGTRQMAFALGGPDGHDPALASRAAFSLSFGAATWPHQLARIMLAEQLYRAATLISGHPYHRA